MPADPGEDSQPWPGQQACHPLATDVMPPAANFAGIWRDIDQEKALRHVSSTVAVVMVEAEGGGAADSAGEDKKQDCANYDSVSSNRAMFLIEFSVWFHPTSNTTTTPLPPPIAPCPANTFAPSRTSPSSVGRLPRVVDFRVDSGGAAHHLLCWQLKLKYLASQVKTSVAQASRFTVLVILT